MAIQLTTEECQAIMSLFRQFEFPNYDQNCRAEEDWLRHPERKKTLYSAREKIISAAAKTPDAVVSSQAPAPQVAYAGKPATVNPAATTAQRLDKDNLVSLPAEKQAEEAVTPVITLSSIPATSPAAQPPEAPKPAETVKAEAPKPEMAKPEIKKEPVTSKKK